MMYDGEVHLRYQFVWHILTAEKVTLATHQSAQLKLAF